MPRYYYSGARDTTDASKKVSIYWLNKRNLIPEDGCGGGRLNWSMNGNSTGNINYGMDTSEEPYIRFDYRTKHSWEPEENYVSYDYKVNLERLECNFGGYRWYFRCLKCNSRVGILYSSFPYFVCRKCANLSYDSCNENKRFRGYPYKLITDECKAEKIYEGLKRRYYKGKPTKKYKKYLRLWGYISEAEKVEMRNVLNNYLIKKGNK